MIGTCAFCKKSGSTTSLAVVAKYQCFSCRKCYDFYMSNLWQCSYWNTSQLTFHVKRSAADLKIVKYLFASVQQSL